MTPQFQALTQARTALQNFVDKVDRGEARSVQSYKEFKAAISALNEAFQSDDTGNPFQVAQCMISWMRAALDCPGFVWDGDQHEAATSTLKAFEFLIYGDIPKMTAEEEIRRLHRELAAAKLDAKNGWDRARMHYAAYHEMQMKNVHSFEPGEGCIIREGEFPRMAHRKLILNEKSTRRTVDLFVAGLKNEKSTLGEAVRGKLADAVSKTLIPAPYTRPGEPTC